MERPDFSEPQIELDSRCTRYALIPVADGGVKMFGHHICEAGTLSLRDALTARLERVAAKRAAHDEKRRALLRALLRREEFKDAFAGNIGVCANVYGKTISARIERTNYDTDFKIEDVPRLIAKLQAIHEFYAPKEAQ